MNKEIRDFCYKYDAMIRPSTQRHWRSQRLNYSDWSSDPSAITAEQAYQNVPMVEITMPEDRFRALLEYNEWIEKTRINDEIDRRFFAHQQEEEIRLRKQHPGLEELYEKYQTMLQLVR
jgi:hypothetical protein